MKAAQKRTREALVLRTVSGIITITITGMVGGAVGAAGIVARAIITTTTIIIGTADGGRKTPSAWRRDAIVALAVQ